METTTRTPAWFAARARAWDVRGAGRQLASLTRALAMPLLGIAIFLLLWQAGAARVQTTLGQLPGPALVWSEAKGLHREYQAKLAAFLLLTSPGTPFIYYGEEIGMEGKKPDENIRLPMQWSADANAGFTTGRPWRAPDGDYETINVVQQSGDANSLLEHYRTLIQLRNNNLTLQTGDLIPIKSNKPSVYTAIRKDENGTFLILANLSDEAVTGYNIALDEAGLAESAYSVETVFGAGQATNPEGSGEAFQKYTPFESLSPFAMYILKLNPK